MKSDNYILFIIFIVTLIMISLLKECNKDRLKELGKNSIKTIIEEFSNYKQALATDSGEWGYEIISITDGKYGGNNRSIIDRELSNNNSSIGDFIPSSVKENIEGNLNTQATIYIPDSNQQWRNSISSYDCSYNLGQECLWVDDNRNNTSIYGPGKFGKKVNINNPPNYGNCNVNEDDIVIQEDQLGPVDGPCNSYRINYYEHITHQCDKYFIDNKLNYNINDDSKIYAKKIDIKEGIYGGQKVDSVNSYFKVRNSNNSPVTCQDDVNTCQDDVNNDGIIVRFKRCSNSDIQNNSALGISDNISNERKKSLKITFRRVWSNNFDDITVGDDENHSIYDYGITKWKVEIDDGNWEGLQIRDFDNLNFSLSLASGKKPLSYINNKYLRHSVKEKLKTSLDNFLTNNIDIKNLLNIDDIKLNTIKNNLYTDKNPDIFPPQNCAYTYSNGSYVSGTHASTCCGRCSREKKYKNIIKKWTHLRKTQMKEYNGNTCNTLTTNGNIFSASVLDNLSLNNIRKKENTHYNSEWTDCVYCGSCCKCQSDIRLKKDINKIGISPMGIPIFTFRFKSDKQNTLYQGTIAQEIINIIPEAVIMGDNGFYMVDYSKIDVDYKKLN